MPEAAETPAPVMKRAERAEARSALARSIDIGRPVYPCRPGSRLRIGQGCERELRERRRESGDGRPRPRPPGPWPGALAAAAFAADPASRGATTGSSRRISWS